MKRESFPGKCFNSSEKVGLEIFDRLLLNLSNLQQRVNHIRALQGELSNTIGKMTGIQAADVMINMPENKLFEDWSFPNVRISISADRGLTAKNKSGRSNCWLPGGRGSNARPGIGHQHQR